jgi:hypothetical protein
MRYLRGEVVRETLSIKREYLLVLPHGVRQRSVELEV